jgi:hypothetical protein
MQPDVDDWKKLSRCIQYLHDSKDLPGLTLEEDGNGVLHWWINTSFAIHQDMKSHTGLMMSMGKGSIISSSTQKRST